MTAAGQAGSGQRERVFHEWRQRDPVGLSRLLPQERSCRRPVEPARPAQRPDADVHQCRHGAVQERLHRARAAALRQGGDLAEMRARRRQAQRPRQCRLHRAPPHLLRDARQFLLRRLFQGARHRARLDAAHPRLRPFSRAPAGHRLSHRRRGGGLLEEDRRTFRRAHHPHRHQRQLLGDGRYRSLRAMLGDLLRPRGKHSGRPARQPRRGRRPLHRDLEPRLHAVRAGHQGRADRPAATVDRHRHGAGAHRRGAAGRARQLRHRPVQGADPRLGGGDRRAGRGAEPGEPPHHRRSSARLELPDRRRRPAFQRGPRLRAEAHHAPRHAPRPAARRRASRWSIAWCRRWCARWGKPIRSWCAARR